MTKSALVLGAGPAGLACASELQQRGVRVCVLERGDKVGMCWRGHYDRLRLHTDKGHSSLPGRPMPRSYPRYPTRAQVIEYLEDYADAQRIIPEFNCEVRSVSFTDHWHVETSLGPRQADIVVVALGVASFPHRPAWDGLDEFEGSVVHSSEYKNADQFAGKRVLVVGLGNSGGEIALDLSETAASVELSVRGAVNVIPKEVLGIPILTLAIAEQALPVALADFVNRQVAKLVFGDLSGLGLRVSDQGPLAQVLEKKKVPLIDIGTMEAIKKGKIGVHPDIGHFSSSQVTFMDGQSSGLDAVVLATGFRPDFRELLPDNLDLLDNDGAPKSSGALSGENGLFFCSYVPSPTGQLREIGLEARCIARAAFHLA